MTRRVTRGVDDLERTEDLPVAQAGVDGAAAEAPFAGAGCALADRSAQLEWVVDPERPAGQKRDALRLALPGNDVCLPRMRADFGAAERFESDQAGEVREVRVRQTDPLEVGDRAPHPPDRGQDHEGMRLAQRVDQRQIIAIVDQVGADIAPPRVSDGLDTGSELHEDSLPP